MIPYYSQWESPALAAQIISGVIKVRDDPLWRASGAATVEEYAEWANHLCGMACFKMILAARTGAIHPTLDLAKAATEFGAYVFRDGELKGLIYAPFVEMAKQRFGVDAQVVTGIAASDLASIVRPGTFFLASVHPSIRWLEAPPPKKGGHLVLVTQADASGVVFHNPSGHSVATQRDVAATYDQLGEFFAGRGVLVLPAAG